MRLRQFLFACSAGLGALAISSTVSAGNSPKLEFSQSASDGFLSEISALLADSPRLKAEQARLEAIEQSVRRARSAGLPNIEIQASTSASSGDYDPGPQGNALLQSFLEGQGMENDFDLAGFGAANTRQAALSVTQPLFTGFRIKNGIVQAKAVVAASRADYEATRQRLTVDMADAYLSVATAEGRRDSAAKSVESLSRQVRAAQVGFEAGQSTRTDIALANARVAAAQARFAANVAEVTAARGRYAALTGRTDLPSSKTDIASLNIPTDVESAVADALTNHPSLIAAAAMVRANQAGTRVAQGARSPSVQLRGTLSTAENQFIPGDEITNTSLIAEMSVPLFKGGAIGSDIARAKAETQASRYLEQDIRRQVEMGVRTSYAAWIAADLSLLAAKSGMEASDLAYRGVVLEQEVGQRTLLDVLRVEEDLQSARAGLLDAEKEAILASFRVRQAMGTLGQ